MTPGPTSPPTITAPAPSGPATASTTSPAPNPSGPVASDGSTDTEPDETETPAKPWWKSGFWWVMAGVVAVIALVTGVVFAFGLGAMLFSDAEPSEGETAMLGEATPAPTPVPVATPVPPAGDDGSVLCAEPECQDHYVVLRAVGNDSALVWLPTGDGQAERVWHMSGVNPGQKVSLTCLPEDVNPGVRFKAKGNCPSRKLLYTVALDS